MALGWVSLLGRAAVRGPGCAPEDATPRRQLDAAVSALGAVAPSSYAVPPLSWSALSRDARAALEAAAANEASSPFMSELLQHMAAAKTPAQRANQRREEEDLWRVLERNVRLLPAPLGPVLPLTPCGGGGVIVGAQPCGGATYRGTGTPEQLEFAAGLAYSTTLTKLVETMPSFKSSALRLRVANLLQRLPQLASAAMHMPSLAAALAALLDYRHTQAVGCCVWLRLLPDAGAAAVETSVPLRLAGAAAAAPRGSGTRAVALEALQATLGCAGDALRYEDFAEEFCRKLLLSSDADLRLAGANVFFDFLADDQHKDWLLRFAGDPALAKLLCERFVSPCANPHETLAVFHLFKIICHNPRKPPEIIAILQKRRFDLLLRLGALGWLFSSSGDPELLSDRATVMAALKAL